MNRQLKSRKANLVTLPQKHIMDPHTARPAPPLCSPGGLPRLRPQHTLATR